MTKISKFPHVAETQLSGLAFAAIRALLLHEADEHDLELPENTETRVTMATEYGHLAFSAIEGGVRATVLSDREDNLFILKESLVDSISHFAPQLIETLSWSDAEAHKGYPPNFQLASVTSVQELGAGFLRIVLQCEDLSSYTDNFIHFRIVLPPKGDSAPEWPTLNENGVTVWPKGNKALHRPVYTARHSNPDTNELTFDVFLHAGGRTTEWAITVQSGEIIGVTGPGGGGVPDTAAITLYADETAFPAVARLLDTLPSNTKGKVVLVTEAGEACGYPMPEHPNLPPLWFRTDELASLADLAISDRSNFGDHMLWFAAEKDEAQKVRTHFKEAGIATKEHYIATYWSRD